MRYLPRLSDRTLPVIWVARCLACTKAPRDAWPSGPATVPLMVAASAQDTAAIDPSPSANRVMAPMTVPPRSNWRARIGGCYPIAAQGAMRCRPIGPLRHGHAHCHKQEPGRDARAAPRRALTQLAIGLD